MSRGREGWIEVGARILCLATGMLALGAVIWTVGGSPSPGTRQTDGTGSRTPIAQGKMPLIARAERVDLAGEVKANSRTPPFEEWTLFSPRTPKPGDARPTGQSQDETIDTGLENEPAGAENAPRKMRLMAWFGEPPQRWVEFRIGRFGETFRVRESEVIGNTGLLLEKFERRRVSQVSDGASGTDDVVGVATLHDLATGTRWTLSDAPGDERLVLVTEREAHSVPLARNIRNEDSASLALLAGAPPGQGEAAARTEEKAR